MLQQKASEPTRNSLQEDPDEAASSQGFLSSTDPPSHSKQLSSSSPILHPLQPSSVPLVPQFPAVRGSTLAPALTSSSLAQPSKWVRDTMCQQA